MKFFKSRRKIATEDVTKTLSAMGKTADETVDDLRRKLDAAVVPELKDGKKKPVPASRKADIKVEAKAEEDAKASEASASGRQVQLFPGFEDQPFEVGYDASFQSDDFGMGQPEPMLVMRWKEGKADWFPMPAMFNKELLVKIHERDNDLDRLLLDYGYDADQLGRPSEVETKTVETGK